MQIGMPRERAVGETRGVVLGDAAPAVIPTAERVAQADVVVARPMCRNGQRVSP